MKWHSDLNAEPVSRYSTLVNKHTPITMEVSTLSFGYGNAVTVLGMIGVLSTFIILVSVFRSYSKSPFRK